MRPGKSVGSRDQITAEHRLPAAKEQIEQQWKTWTAQDVFYGINGRREAVTRAQAATEIPEYDE